jgi:hypothetical protein
MDWTGRVLRRLVEFTQGGGEVNVVVMGLNAGVQPYWIAAATSLLHTRGIVVMTPEGAMMLAGRQALDGGGVPAEEAQYSAKDLGEACRILLRHYEHTYAAPGERSPRPAATGDPREREVPPDGELRHLMAAVVDQDHEPLERWYGMRGAESAVVWDAHLGGRPVCLLGFEANPRFDLAAKKVARAIDAASGSRPLVVLAGLSGFDGAPEPIQLEYAAGIGRALVSFQGPIVVCAVSRHHGDAFAAFSAALHDELEVVALDGTVRLRPSLIDAVERGMARK